MTKRGLQIASQGRYLFDTFQGEATAEYLYNDRVTGETRWGVSWKHTQNLNFLPGLVGYWNLQQGLRRHVFRRLWRTASD